MDGFDELWPGGPVFRQGGFRLSTDSVLLADFAAKVPSRKIIDLGAGAGVLTVLLSVSHPLSQIEALEIQEESAALCRVNLEANAMSANVTHGDLREHRSLYPAGSFDLVVSNPPYFSDGSGFTAPEVSRATARDERSCTLDDLCQAAKYLCRWGGYFCIVHRPERLSEIFCTMTRHGLEPKRLRMVQHHEGAAPNLVLIEARRGGKPGLNIQSPLILTANGGDSEEIKTIYHRG